MGTYVPPLPIQNFLDKKTVVTAQWANAIDNMLQGNIPANGVYNPTFVSGQVQLTGPNGYLISYGDFGFSLLSPGPVGTGPFLRVAGAGKNFGQIGTDAQVPGQHGIDLAIAGGDTAPGDNNRGGNLTLFGGASGTGTGGGILVQAGSSASGTGGDITLAGGNSVANLGPAGNIYIIAGVEGNAGGNVKVYSTNLNGAAGDISFWLGQPDIPHSIPLWTMSHTGALFPANQGAGNAPDFVNLIPGSVLVSGGNLASPNWAPINITGAMTLNLSGGTISIPQVVMNYQIVGTFVFLWTNSGVSASPTGPNDIIISTLPVGIRPSSPREVMCGGLLNGGAAGYFGIATIDALGGITIALGIPTNAGTSIGALPNNWSNAGPKGITPAFSVCYAL